MGNVRSWISVGPLSTSCRVTLSFDMTGLLPPLADRKRAVASTVEEGGVCGMFSKCRRPGPWYGEPDLDGPPGLLQAPRSSRSVGYEVGMGGSAVLEKIDSLEADRWKRRLAVGLRRWLRTDRIRFPLSCTPREVMCRSYTVCAGEGCVHACMQKTRMVLLVKVWTHTTRDDTLCSQVQHGGHALYSPSPFLQGAGAT